MKKLLYPTLVVIMAMSCKNDTHQQPGTTATTTEQVTAAKQMPVILLATADATEYGEDGNQFEYPKTFAPPEGVNTTELAAYGAAHNVWLGPKGWTGDGSAATNGGKTVNLYPKAGDKLDGPHVVYYSESSCLGCMLGHAAAYFPNALKEYNETYNDDGTNPVEIHPALAIHSISPTLVTFTLPDSNGLRRSGAVYYIDDSTGAYYLEATFALPAQQSEVSDALTKGFIARMSQE
jgi:hypothetical protein